MKLYHELNETEFEDMCYFCTQLERDETNIDYSIFITCKPYYSKEIPYLMVFPSNIRYINMNKDTFYAQISIEDKNIYYNNLLSTTDILNINKFIDTNKEVILNYWDIYETDYSTTELCANIIKN